MIDPQHHTLKVDSIEFCAIIICLALLAEFLNCLNLRNDQCKSHLSAGDGRGSVAKIVDVRLRGFPGKLLLMAILIQSSLWDTVLPVPDKRKADRMKNK